ncbi:MAG: TonB-dependent receptor [Bacteroidales bacterium]|nr:TonB-dependent receptor [Bacteroidales bacterium]
MKTTMKQTAALAFSILVCVVSQAQTYKISGRVADAQSQQEVPYANIMIVSDTSAQSKMINGVTATQDGTFTIETKTKKTFMKVNSLGYKDNVFAVDADKYAKTNNQINIGTVYLDVDARMLGGVDIVAKQTRIEMDNDKIVMNVDEGVTATSANVFEMLRKVPGVVIDKDENISLQGQSGVLFQFDGRDIRIPYEAMKSILKGMSPGDVAKIETITNPSSKYEAEGTAGIINIIMAKEQTEGFSGSVSSWNGVNKDFKSFDNISLSYVTPKWTVTAGGGIGYMDNRNTMQMDQWLYGSGTDTTWMHQDEYTMKHKFRSYNASLSADYKIDDNNSVGAMFNYSGHKMPEFKQDPQLMKVYQNDWASPLFSYAINSKQNNKSDNFMASVYYNHKFDTLGGQYSVSFDFNRNSSYDKSTNITDYFAGDFITKTDSENLFNDADNGYSSYAFKFDVNHPVNKNMSFEYGVKSRLAAVDNDFMAYKDGSLDNNRTNHLKYKENVNAAFVSFASRFNQKFSARAGLRFEHTYTSIEQKATGDKHGDNYFDLFPNINLNYKVGSMDNLSLTYSYRISRPDYNSLNPFVVKQSDYNYTAGNPLLEPEYTHKVDINYAWHYIVFLRAGYGYTDNSINQVILTQNSPLRTTQQPFNIGYEQDFSLSLSSMLPLGPLEWTLWLQGAWQQMKADDELLQTDIKKFSFMTWQSLAVDFLWQSKLSLSCFYSTGGVQMGGEYSDMLMLSASVSKDFLKKALKVSVGVDQFPKRNFEISTHYNNYRMEGNMCWQRPQFTVNVSYNFGKSANNNTLKKLQSDDMDDRKSGESNVGGGQGTPMGR